MTMENKYKYETPPEISAALAMMELLTAQTSAAVLAPLLVLKDMERAAARNPE